MEEEETAMPDTPFRMRWQPSRVTFHMPEPGKGRSSEHESNISKVKEKVKSTTPGIHYRLNQIRIRVEARPVIFNKTHAQKDEFFPDLLFVCLFRYVCS